MDCSVLVAVLFQEPLRDEALRSMAGRSLHAPALLDSEVANVAVKKSRGGLPQAMIGNALDMYVQHTIELHRPDVPGQYALAIRYGLSACDAAYLWLAGALQAPLVTFDAKLGAAARDYLTGAR
ncbi:type II toxin-antitoxin system VapC family toxin [Ramlibacter sp. PS3R-8]|uniref:type II toxin-antitoxin system VapC family toxin n=1 Tax=Ramlibacter sp. PS3R-8 TaxID=3133437 RepID=UPI0030A65918